MHAASGVRIGWHDLPGPVRDAIERILSDRVVEAVSQTGGFSPGTADRVVTASGRRAFVKAVSPEQNDRSVAMLRREVEVTAALPAQIPAPRVLGHHDDGHWVALILSDVDGRHPATPWTDTDIAVVMRALTHVADLATPAPLPLEPVAERLRYDFGGWARTAADPPADLDPWVSARLDALHDAATAALDALSGTTLVHVDLRADNILLGADGRVTLVDWPWAAAGPPWLDRLLVLAEVAAHGGHDVDALIGRWLPDAPSDAVTGVVAGLAGFLIDRCRQPDPPGLPTIRAFQRAFGQALLPVLRSRMP